MWTLFYGDANETTAQVYARFDGAAAVEAESALTLRGPICQRARTLPTKFAFLPIADNVWRCTVVDPVFWSPELPARYQLHWGGQGRAVTELGIRRLGVRNGSLFFNGARWVLRAATVPGQGANALQQDSTSLETLVEACRANYLSLVVDANHTGFDRLADIASRAGLLLVAQWTGASQETSKIRTIAQLPAVAIVVLSPDMAQAPGRFREHAPNVLLAADHRFSRSGSDGASNVSAPHWADIVIGSDDVAALQATRSSLPGSTALVSFSDSTSAAVAENELVTSGQRLADFDPPRMRRACEQLQASLAPALDLAGYLVRW